MNESPTDKLIRELREENARLLEMMKRGGSIPSSVGMGANLTDEEKERIRREAQEEVERQVRTPSQPSLRELYEMHLRIMRRVSFVCALCVCVRVWVCVCVCVCVCCVGADGSVGVGARESVCVCVGPGV